MGTARLTTNNKAVASDLNSGPRHKAERKDLSRKESVQGKSMETPTTPSSDSGLSEEHKCELCGTCFETRRGLSSHARCHLRQLGVSVSDSSGAPIELLYRLIEERDGQLPKPAPQPNPIKRRKGLPAVKKEVQGPALKLKISNLVRKKYSIFSQTSRKTSAAATSAAIAGRLSQPPAPTATLRRFGSSASTSSSPLTPLHVKEARPSAERSPLATSSGKPTWAPQDSDAPLDLMTVDPAGRDDVHVCELCGAWFETRKGLSSHARAHLRTFGIDTAEAKGAPIDTLHKFMISKGLKPGSAGAQPSGVKQEESTLAISAKRPAPPSPSPRAGAKGAASSPSPSAKRFKSSSSEGLPLLESLQKEDDAKSDGESARDIVCEFCGELFMRSQSLSSHARSHLRQLGITEWSVQGSPMATLREVMAQRGVSSILKLPSSAPASHSLPSARSPLKIPPPPASPLRIPSAAAAPLKLPKARKGSRFVNKPKDEPTEVDVSEVVAIPGPSRSGTPQSPFRSDLGSANTQLMRAPKTEPDVNQPVECDYCNDTFDSRKALSCHARAHLRQLGARWPAQASPIDALHELMQREGTTRASKVKREPSPAPSPGRRQSASPVAFTPPPGEPAAKGAKASSEDATCELCGFDFENRKALASHARAHLRQQGVDWRLNGSPIETLSAWMQKEPGKVAELHKRYMMGDLPHIRKRSSSSPCPSSDSEAPHGGGGHRASSLLRSSLGLPQGSSRASGSRDKSHGSHSSAGAHSELNVRQPREPHTTFRRPPKHQSHTESRVRENKPPKPSRSGNVPSLVPRPPDTPLVRQVGKVYSLKCRFCDKEFRGPLSVQEDWVRHLQEHILNLKKDAAVPTSPLSPATPAPPLHLTPQPV
ncbi:protein Wiz isoform X2 [Sardina pilchardus]|uniref:protein Wiz isoform X2 n=1 Tax=Sardina pilchardus TaxID=27697 RepID=UPI002E0FF45B